MNFPIEEWVAMAQAGDKDAFERLMATHAETLADRLRLWIARPEDVEDVLQQVYLRAWMDLPALRDPASFRFWLISLARRRCHSFLRSKRKREQAATVEDLEQYSAAKDIRRTQVTASRHSVLETLADAPLELRAAAEAVYLRGLSIPETAHHLGCSEGTVKRRLMDARAFLRSELETEGLTRRKEPIMNKPATLDEALALVCERLKKEGKAQYVGLLGRDEVVAAIHRAIKWYESYCSEKARGYFDGVIKIMLLQMTEGGAWPEHATLDYFFEIKKGLGCQGFSLGVEIVTPEKEFKGFSLPILDLWYGWWGEESES